MSELTDVGADYRTNRITWECGCETWETNKGEPRWDASNCYGAGRGGGSIDLRCKQSPLAHKKMIELTIDCPKCGTTDRWSDPVYYPGMDAGTVNGRGEHLGEALKFSCGRCGYKHQLPCADALKPLTRVQR